MSNQDKSENKQEITISTKREKKFFKIQKFCNNPLPVYIHFA